MVPPVVRFFIKEKTRDLARNHTQVRFHARVSHAGSNANVTTWEEWQWIKGLLLDWLTVDQRDVMALILDGYTPIEIAEMIEATPEAVRQRLILARRSLVRAWRQRDDVEPGGSEVKGTS